MVQILTLYWTMDPDPGSTIYTQWPSPSPRRCFSLFLPHFTKMAYSRRSRFRRRRYPARRYARRSFRPTCFALGADDGPTECRHVVCAILRRANAGITCCLRLERCRRCTACCALPNDRRYFIPVFVLPIFQIRGVNYCPRRTPDFCELYGALEV